MILVALAVIAVDQITKMWAVAALAGQPSIEVIGSFLQLTYVENTGAAFGLGAGMAWLFTIAAIIVTIVILRISRNLGSTAWAITLGGLMGGALGNAIDRITREPGLGRGYVVDFFELPYWPVFNVADIAVVVSAITMVALSIFGIGLRGRVTAS
jgi:signal peptidase II